MYGTKTFFMAVFTVFAIATVQDPTLALAITKEVKSKASVDLQLIGEVGRKQFFFDNGINRDWETASAHCKEAGMELASLQTREETEHVVAAIRAAGGGQRSTWTSGRSNTAPDGFVWENTGNQLSSNIVENWNSRDSYDFCVILNVDVDSSPFFFRRAPCSTAYKGVLCQIISKNTLP